MKPNKGVYKNVKVDKKLVVKATPVDVNTRSYLNKQINVNDTKQWLKPDQLDDEVIWDPDYFKDHCGAKNTRESRQRAWIKWETFLNAVGTRHVLDGIKRTQFALFGISNGKQARALTDKLCDAFVDISNENDGNIMLVCKHAVLRSDNVCMNKNRHHLCVKHVRVVKENDEEVVILDLPGSKTNQFCIPEERVLYHRKKMCNGGEILADMCPACVCIKLSNIRSIKRAPNDALFVRMNGKPYSYSHLNQLTKSCAKYFDLDPALYTTHCLRRGGATDLFGKYEKSLDWIMVHCNWESKETVMQRYLKAHNPDLEAPLIKFYWLRR